MSEEYPREPGSLSIKFTEIEHDILRLLASGETNKPIGEALVLTEAAVKAILRKLHVGNRTQAATRAYHHGISNGGIDGMA